MRIILISLLVLSSCTHFKSSEKKISLMQSFTSSKEVEFNAIYSKNKNIRFELIDSENMITLPSNTLVFEKSYSSFAVYKAQFLKDPQKKYTLHIFEGQKLLDKRQVGEGQKESHKLKIILTSNLNMNQDLEVWNLISQKRPEQIILMGGFLSPAPTNKDLWTKYIEHRHQTPLYYLNELIPTHAVWDKNEALASNGTEIFKIFWGSSFAEEDDSTFIGSSASLNLGDFNLYFLDSWTFRSDTDHLGAKQSEWLYSKLKEESTPSLLIKGDHFFNDSHSPSFTSFTQQMKLQTTPFVLLSADKERSEIMQFPRSLFGRPSFEITAGPMNLETPSQETLNPWRVVENKDHPSFTLIENVAEDDHWFLDISNIGLDDQLYYKRELAVFIKDLQNNLNEVRKRRFRKRRYQRRPVRK